MNMKYEVIFESKRINFIKLNKDLVNDYLDMVNDYDVQKYIHHKKRVYTLEQELDWIEDKLNTNAVIFSMIEKETNDFIGNIEIMDIENNVGELGITITPKKQDKHYGQEAINALIDYAFNTIHLKDIYLDVFNFNERAIACYEKVGFVKAGTGKTIEDIHMIYKK